MPSILIASVIIVNFISVLILKELNVIALIASVAGVVSVTMSAKGHISCYYAGVINNITYLVIALSSKFYGTVILQGFFFLPMQFIGIAQWRKNLNKGAKVVKMRQMPLKKLLIIIVGSIIFSLVYSLVLNLISGNLPYVDALITSLSLVAMGLSVKRYQEQWLFWLGINIANVMMWSLAALNQAENGILMTITWLIYLVNSVYGLINWQKQARRDG